MARPTELEATFEAAPNIALVKYWGVRDAERVLPTNSSISVTLERFRSRTRVRFDPDRSADRVRLNGTPAEGAPRDDVVRFLDHVRALAGISWHADVVSRNNFPMASGLASSASGFAALAGASAAAVNLRRSPRALSQLARLGSGSAARSIFGGFVEWRAGTRPDGRDCYARPLFPASHWPGLLDLVVLVDRAPVKQIRSNEAMQATVRTSPGYPRRIAEVPARLRAIRSALGRRDPERLFPLVMEECDSFREVCETTRPALDYLTSTSRAVLAEVRSINRGSGRAVAAYTHDAGAHVHVFSLSHDLGRVRARIARLPGVRRTLALRPGAGGRLLRGPAPRPRRS